MVGGEEDSAVLGAEDGRAFLSSDRGRSWALVTKGLPAVRCIALG